MKKRRGTRPAEACSFRISLFQLFQRPDCVHIVQLGSVHFQEHQGILVTPDDCISAAVLPQLQQLREKPGGEEAGVAPDAVMAQGRDLIRLLLPKVRQCGHRFPPQQWLIRYQKQHAVAVLQRRQPQFDGVTDAKVGMFIADSCKAKILCEFCNL